MDKVKLSKKAIAAATEAWAEPLRALLNDHMRANQPPEDDAPEEDKVRAFIQATEWIAGGLSACAEMGAMLGVGLARNGAAMGGDDDIRSRKQHLAEVRKMFIEIFDANTGDFMAKSQVSDLMERMFPGHQHCGQEDCQNCNAEGTP